MTCLEESLEIGAIVKVFYSITLLLSVIVPGFLLRFYSKGGIN